MESTGTVSPGQSSILLQDLFEKKQNLRRIASEVVTMAAELRDVRSRMAAQEAMLEQETARRQSAEVQARTMEKELDLLQKNLEEKDSQALRSLSVAEQYLQELMGLREKLAASDANANATYMNSTHLQCATLLKEIEEKNESLQEYEKQVARLGQQLVELQQDLRQREISQKQLRDEVERMEGEIKLAVTRATTNKDSELRKLLDEVSARNLEQLAKHLRVKDDEIVQLKGEIKFTSAEFRLKIQDLETQLEKRRRADQELKKRVIKLECLLQEARSQTWKLQRIAEWRDREIKDLRAQLLMKEADSIVSQNNYRFWDSSRFRLLLSVSAIVLVLLAKH